jgi:hypothetical protein
MITVGKTVDTAKLIATDMPRVLRSEPGKRERDDTLSKSVIGNELKHCDACADEGDEKGLPRARLFFASGLKVVFHLLLVCQIVANSNVADNIGDGKNEKTTYGCT